ncbi:MAG TPA: hypothetical protein EYQ09_02015 [Flavobacteriales bacterium]|nr:hypothetical protein [Flavobacteriales bacterium]
MKLLNYLLVVFLFVSACKKDTKEETPVLPADYGSGMYIVTENGISFYDGEVVKNQIYQKVNGRSIFNGKKIKFRGTKAYIVTDNQILTANVKTFENKEEIKGFTNAVDFDFVSNNRLFVVDQADAKIKVVDLLTLDITSDIETGNNTQPVFIVSKWWRSIVLNGGLVADFLKDSTIVAIDYSDNLVPLADFNGSVYVGDNPNSAVWINDLKILCKGIYDPNNLLNNTEAILVRVHPWNMEVVWVQTLSNIYNAQNLISESSDAKYFFTAADGVYQMNNDGSGISKKINFTSDFIDIKVESYDLTDTTSAYANMLYVNDAINNPNTIYKYNIATSVFSDTIVVDGNVRDIAFYE